MESKMEILRTVKSYFERGLPELSGNEREIALHDLSEIDAQIAALENGQEIEVTEPEQKLFQDLQRENTAAVEKLLSYKVEYDADGNQKRKKLLQTVANWRIVLENDARFKGRIRYDAFLRQITLYGYMPWVKNEQNIRPWNNIDDCRIYEIIQRDYGLERRQDCQDAIGIVSDNNRYHPIIEMLESYIWDGKEHIAHLLTDYLGAMPTEYNQAVMRLGLLGQVARVESPGIKFDYIPILHGAQGIGKTRFIRHLPICPEWFSDSMDNLEGARAIQSLLGTWVVELGELKALARTSGGINAVKSFVSAQADKIRLPYQKRDEIFPRQNVFWGSTNDSLMLDDVTGNRRFLIVECGLIEPTKDLFADNAGEDFKQALAQAWHIWKTERPDLILPKDVLGEAETMQKAYVGDNGTAGLIERYLEGKVRVCVLELWQEALGEDKRPARWQANEIVNIVMNIPGWERLKNPTRYGKYGNQRLLVRKMDGFMPTDGLQGEIPFD